MSRAPGHLENDTQVAPPGSRHQGSSGLLACYILEENPEMGTGGPGSPPQCPGAFCFILRRWNKYESHQQDKGPTMASKMCFGHSMARSPSGPMDTCPGS